MRGRRPSGTTPTPDMLATCLLHLPEPFRRTDIVQWFRRHHPQVSEAALVERVTVATEDPLRDGYVGAAPPLLVRIDHEFYRRYRSPDDVDRVSGSADVLLVGGGQRTRSRPGPARDIYRSALFSRARDYAEATEQAWYVLSARYGLVAPDTVIGASDGRLGDRSPAYRDAWATWVVAQLLEDLGDVRGACFEMHANEPYVASLRDRLTALGATVGEPLSGLGRDDRLAWYDARVAKPEPRPEIGPELSEEVLLELIDAVADPTTAMAIEALEAVDPDELARPGLYACFVDADGAVELSAGTGCVVRSGIVYAGVAGGSRRANSSRTADTLRGRLLEVHLAPNSHVSTFRHTLAAALRPVHGWDTVDEVALTHWMCRHLRVTAVAVADEETSTSPRPLSWAPSTRR